VREKTGESKVTEKGGLGGKTNTRARQNLTSSQAAATAESTTIVTGAATDSMIAATASTPAKPLTPLTASLAVVDARNVNSKMAL
jgi:hypothetical protein